MRDRPRQGLVSSYFLVLSAVTGALLAAASDMRTAPAINGIHDVSYHGAARLTPVLVRG
jgi:hypothetical protein